MAGGYASLFSTYTDEQLLELARKRDNLAGAARDALDTELKKRGYNPEAPGRRTTPTPFSPNLADLRLNPMSRFFVRAPGWVIFLVICVVGLFAYMVELSGVRKSIDLVAASFGVGIVAAVFEVGWEWSLGSFLSRVTHPSLRMKATLFQLATAFSLILLSSFTVFFFRRPDSFYWMVFCDACAIICHFYLMYFVAKSLVLAEKSVRVSFYDYAAPFFMILFLPIGIWRAPATSSPPLRNESESARLADFCPFDSIAVTA